MIYIILDIEDSGWYDMPYEQINMIAFLERWTTYSHPYLSNLPPHKLYVIYHKIKRERFQLIEDIITLQNGLLEKEYSYTKQQLNTMKNQELQTLKKRLYNPPKKEYSFNEKDVLFLDPQDGESKQVNDCEFLTASELREMYGDLAMEYSLAELQKRGIYSTDFSNKTMEMKDDLMEELITFFMEAHKRGIIYFPFSRKETKKRYTLDSLKLMYSTRVLNNQVEGFPSLEEISARLSLSPF